MKLHEQSFIKHQNHQMYVDSNPKTKKGQPVYKHVASLRCRNCDQHIKWLSKDEANQIQSIMAQDIMASPGVTTRPTHSPILYRAITNKDGTTTSIRYPDNGRSA